jgi:NADH-quinone oxidoreductase subunit L
MLFLAFHGEERFDTSAHAAQDNHAGDEHAHDASHDAGAEPDPHGHAGGPPKESPWVVTLPLVLLAVPSMLAGWLLIEPMLVGGYFGNAIAVKAEHPAAWALKGDWYGVPAFIRHGVLSPPFWLAVAGIVSAWYCYLVNPALPERLKHAAGALYTLLDNKYYFDRFNDWAFAGGARAVGTFLSNVGDRSIIDGFFVNGTVRVVGWTAALLRHLQSGYVYHYAFTMIIGLFALLSWWSR